MEIPAPIRKLPAVDRIPSAAAAPAGPDRPDERPSPDRTGPEAAAAGTIGRPADDDQIRLVLYRIASLIGRTDDPRCALEAILAELISFFRAPSGSVALLNPDSGRLEL